MGRLNLILKNVHNYFFGLYKIKENLGNVV